MAQRGFIKITPLDGLFFGKGRPFNMGDDTWTDADLLPQPGVVWGAIASQLYYSSGNTINPAALSVGPVMLIRGSASTDSTFLPAPLDILIDADGNKHHHTFFWKRSKEDEKSRFVSQRETDVLLKPHTMNEVEQPEQKLISLAYLYEKYPSETSKVNFGLELLDMEEQIATEFKIGIGRDDDTRTAREGMLFTVQLSQLKEGASLLVEFDNQSGIELPPKGILKLGGEGKMATYEVLDMEQALPISIASLQKKTIGDTTVHSFFKALALMPLPLDVDGLPEALKHDEYDILGGVTGKPILIGGYDYDKKRPKPMQKYAPAGSVWVLGVKQGEQSIAHVAEALNLTHQPGRLNTMQLFPYLSI